MANKKSEFKKRVTAVHLEPKLIDILKKESMAAGCISHPNQGFSVSEAARRLIKGRIIQLRPYIKNSAKDIDWSEAI
ncbi:MAG: hypothetical protein LLG05_03400 [Porphyromonadaceae bacterium]|nr:hypothetical protein [Porphyromonadaceae bacterium]